MSMVPPTAKTAVSVAVFCEAGRRISLPTHPDWNKPCMQPGTEPFCIVEEDNSEMWVAMCAGHMGHLIAAGLAI